MTDGDNVGRETWGPNLFLISREPAGERAPSAAFCRIDLKEATSGGWFHEETERVQRAPSDQSVLIVHFEERFEDAAFNRSKLDLIERLVKVMKRTVVPNLLLPRLPPASLPGRLASSPAFGSWCGGRFSYRLGCFRRSAVLGGLLLRPSLRPIRPHAFGLGFPGFSGHPTAALAVSSLGGRLLRPSLRPVGPHARANGLALGGGHSLASAGGGGRSNGRGGTSRRRGSVPQVRERPENGLLFLRNGLQSGLGTEPGKFMQL
jgi:hypothetical protein